DDLGELRLAELGSETALADAIGLHAGGVEQLVDGDKGDEQNRQGDQRLQQRDAAPRPVLPGGRPRGSGTGAGGRKAHGEAFHSARRLVTGPVSRRRTTTRGRVPSVATGIVTSGSESSVASGVRAVPSGRKTATAFHWSELTSSFSRAVAPSSTCPASPNQA